MFPVFFLNYNLIFILIKSDIRQLRRRLFHCQGRTPLYFQTRFARIPLQDIQARHNNTKGNSNLPTTLNRQINRNSPTKRPLSLSDQNKTHRTAYTTTYLDKDITLITKTRHTT